MFGDKDAQRVRFFLFVFCCFSRFSSRPFFRVFSRPVGVDLFGRYVCAFLRRFAVDTCQMVKLSCGCRVIHNPSRIFIGDFCPGMSGAAGDGDDFFFLRFVRDKAFRIAGGYADILQKNGGQACVIDTIPFLGFQKIRKQVGIGGNGIRCERVGVVHLKMVLYQLQIFIK